MNDRYARWPLSSAQRRPHRRRVLRVVRPEQLEERTLLASGPLISEFMADNTATVSDEDGDYSDWIEIHNPTGVPVSLAGWHLTDDPDRLARWTFPEWTLQPGVHLVVFASGKDRRPTLGPLHTNFRLAAEGEYLALTRPDQTVASELAAPYPQQFTDVSFGVSGTASETWLFFAPATPGIDNGPGFATVASAPRVMLASGTYFDAQQVVVTNASATARIHYSTNGAEPTRDDPRYVEPLTVASSMLLRLRAFEDGQLPSPTVTQSYIVVAAELASRDSNLPLVIIDTLGNSIPGSESPQMASTLTTLIDARNGARAALTGVADFTGRAGLRVRGSSSTEWPKKNFSFETWDAAGNDQNVELLGFPADADWVLFASYLDRTLLQDSLVQDLARQMGRASLRTRPVEVYLNTGRAPVSERNYHGVYLLMERIEVGEARVDIAEMAASDNAETEISGGYLLKIDRGNATIAASLSRDLVPVEPDAAEMTTAQREWITKYIADFEAALSGPDFADPLRGYAKYIDVDAWIDYHLMSELTFNVDEWYLSTYLFKDRGGKLTLGPFWDFDRAWGNTNQIGADGTSGWYSDAIGNFFAAYHGVPLASVVEYPWFRRLFEDPSFRQRYADRWHELRGAAWSSANILSLIDTGVAELGESQVRNFQRWRTLNTSIAPSPRRFATYEEHVADLKRWILDRLAWIDSQFPTPPEIDPSSGRVPVGTVVSIAVPGPDRYLETDLVAASAELRYVVPLDTAWDNDWMAPVFDDATWARGRNGVGYEQVPTSEPNFVEFIGTQVPVGTTSTYLRFRFEGIQPGALDKLLLRVRYDDGFAAYLNGVPVARANAPSELAFDSSASTARPDSQAIVFQEFDLSESIWQLDPSVNHLAIHGLNAGSASPDFLTQIWLVGATRQPNLPLDVPIYYTTDGSDPRAENPIVDEQVLLGAGAMARAVVPTTDLGTAWRDAAFDDQSWQGGSSAVGFEKTPGATINYQSLIGLDLLAQIDPVVGGANEFKGAYARWSFQVDNVRAGRLILRVKYDDAFVAYLNGVEIARSNLVGVDRWDAAASAPRLDADALEFQEFDVTAYRQQLNSGSNMLAVHVLNAGIVDADMLLLPELIVRSESSGIAASARLWTGPITIQSDTRIIARSLAEGHWSAQAVGVFTTGALPVRISELMYHPSDVTSFETAAGVTEEDDFEFIELLNLDLTRAINLDGVQLAGGIEFLFPTFWLEPGQRVVLVKNRAAFQLRYGAGTVIGGEYQKNLGNAGETLTLADATGHPLQEIAYRDSDPWPVLADGRGASLHVLDPWSAPRGDGETAYDWAALAASPGLPPQADLNGDGRMDVADLLSLCTQISSSDARLDLDDNGVFDRNDMLYFVEQVLHGSVGDANQDGRFNSSDLVRVFQAGEYEDHEASNSTWIEGDWNCDGDFTTLDLVFAFQYAHYDLNVIR